MNPFDMPQLRADADQEEIERCRLANAMIAMKMIFDGITEKYEPTSDPDDADMKLTSVQLRQMLSDNLLFTQIDDSYLYALLIEDGYKLKMVSDHKGQNLAWLFKLKHADTES